MTNSENLNQPTPVLPRRRRSRKRWLGPILFVLAAMTISALWLNRELRIPVAHEKANDYIEISRRSSPEGIVNKLVSEGVLRRKWPLLIYIKLTGSAKLLKAGEYRFPSPITPLAVLKKLEEGEQRLSRFTVIEGWTRWDIADSLAHVDELQWKDSGEALTLMDETSGIRDLDRDSREKSERGADPANAARNREEPQRAGLAGSEARQHAIRAECAGGGGGTGAGAALRAAGADRETDAEPVSR